jgi:hypothetical protein
MALGLLVGLWLLPAPRTVGGITLDVHTLLYAAMALVVGFQAIIFALFTKIFAITEGLLPEDPRLNQLFRYVTLEVGLVLGALLLLVGLGMSAYAVRTWGMQAFGDLVPSQTLRIAIPAATLITISFQIILSSFFLSILGLKRR